MECSAEFITLRNDCIIRQVDITGIMEAVEPVHIGVTGGMFADKNTLAMLKDSSGRPYIPGTSLKGVFRSLYEIEVSDRGKTVCPGIDMEIPENFNPDVIKKRYIVNENGRIRTCGRRLGDRIEQLGSAGGANEAFREIQDKMCEACKIFGTTGYTGSAIFFDAVLHGGKYSAGIKPGINLSREKRGPPVPFGIEYVDAGSLFDFRMSLRNPANYMIGGMLTALRHIHEGMYKIGGQKSRGFGLVKFSGVSMRVKNYSSISGGEHDGRIKLNRLAPRDSDVEVPRSSLEGESFFENMKPFYDAFEAFFR